jgi:peptidyl-prolyl cis-trans isomerase C
MKFVALWVTVLALTCAVGAQSPDPDLVLATVNGEAIRQQTIDFTMRYLVLPQYAAQNNGQALPDDQYTQIAQGLLNQAITETLIIQHGRAAGVTVNEQIVQAQLESLTAQRPGIPETELRAFLHQKLLAQTTLQQLVTGKVTVTDYDVRALYDEQKDQMMEPEQVRASHILVSVNADASDADKAAARHKIDEILAQARTGEDFAELARRYSDCPTSQKGGDLGFFSARCHGAGFRGGGLCPG